MPKIWQVLDTSTTKLYDMYGVYPIDAIRFLAGRSYVLAHQAEYFPTYVKVGYYVCWLD